MSEEKLYLDKFTEEEWLAPVFIGGPTRMKIEEWKQQYGAIYMLPFEEGTYIVRGLMRPEFRRMQLKDAELVDKSTPEGETPKMQKSLQERVTSRFDNEEEVASICTLFPEHANTEDYFMNVKAGIAGTIADVVYDKSCFRYVMPPVPL